MNTVIFKFKDKAIENDLNDSQVVPFVGRFIQQKLQGQDFNFEHGTEKSAELISIEVKFQS